MPAVYIFSCRIIVAGELDTTANTWKEGRNDSKPGKKKGAQVKHGSLTK